MRSIDPWTHAVRWPISGTAMSSVSYPGKKKEGKRFWILDIPPVFVQRDTVYREVNKFYLFIVSFIIFIRGDLLRFDFLAFNKFILFCYLVGKVGGSWSNVEGEHWTESKSGSALPAERDENLSPGIRSTSSQPGWEATAEKEERSKKERLMTSEHRRDISHSFFTLFTFADGKSFVPFDRS